MSNLHKLAFIAVLLSLGACSRMTVVPEDPPPSAGPVVMPPASDYGSTMPPPTSYPTYPVPSGQQAVHVVQAGETLYRIGLRYGYDYRQIAAWNNIGAPYNISVGQRLIVSPPGGTATPGYTLPPATSAPSIPSAPATQPVSSQYHTVARGETLYSISRIYGRSFEELAAWNNIPPPYALSVGQTLLVSSAGGGTVYQPSQPTIVNFQPPVTSAPASASYHTVSAGETLYSIARRYGRHYTEIAAWNNIPAPYTVGIGQRLIVGGSATSSTYRVQTVAQPVSVPPGSAQNVHVVARGETLHSIAQRYGRDYRDVAAWNRLSAPYKLLVGQNLVIGGSASAPTSAPSAPVYSPPAYSASSVPASSSSGLKTYHIVQKGESLAMIAQRYGQTPLDLALWNGIKPPYQLEPGQSLLVGK
jgi:LysM repeat protein